MKYLKTFNESVNEIDEIINFIRPEIPMLSKESEYRIWGEDFCEEDLRSEDYLNVIKNTVFKEDSDTSKRFGYNFITIHKDEILARCKEHLTEIDEEENDDDPLKPAPVLR